MDHNYARLDHNTLKVGAINVCGLKSKLKYRVIQDYIKQFDIICVSETKLNPQTKEENTQDIHIEDFTVLNKLKETGHFIAGGIAVYVKNIIANRVKLSANVSVYIL